MAFDFNNIEDNDIDNELKCHYLFYDFERTALKMFKFPDNSKIPTQFSNRENIEYDTIGKYNNCLKLPTYNRPPLYQMIDLLNHDIFNYAPDYKIIMSGTENSTHRQFDYIFNGCPTYKKFETFEKYIKACSHISNFTYTGRCLYYGAFMNIATDDSKCDILFGLTPLELLVKWSHLYKEYTDVFENIHISKTLIQYYLDNFTKKPIISKKSKDNILNKMFTNSLILRNYELYGNNEEYNGFVFAPYSLGALVSQLIFHFKLNH